MRARPPLARAAEPFLRMPGFCVPKAYPRVRHPGADGEVAGGTTTGAREGMAPRPQDAGRVQWS
ncbi:hypothetical protein GCM10019016_032460 [Streptomyces prasinosporus]|uniref:Uncharacterized protein n=1 Tax=Streptomyces prasinosporus TaxID=68256 RepID=A0ABP6TN18_9ACTN